MNSEIDFEGQPQQFKAETRQLLDILIHSLYTEKEVFLRELISNASDALTRANFEMLTNRDVLDPDAELGIWITCNPQEKLLTIKDTGIGMNAKELAENLGTIAHSGARAFLQAAQENKGAVSDIIGQFGVGFYSAFMVAESIQVTSRSYRHEDSAAIWRSNGSDTYTIEPAEKNDRGTEIQIKLNQDAEEFLQEYKLRSAITRHSDYVPYPIYLGDNQKQVNQQTAIWRKPPRQVEEKEYEDFYRQFTLDVDPALDHLHLDIDAPYQVYALLYIPGNAEHTVFSLRKQDGVKLYSRKILIQEYSKDLLPEFYRFIQGVVDSEDIPLNVSRESIQSNRVMITLKKMLTSKVTDLLKSIAENKTEVYKNFWVNFGAFIKEGVATDMEYSETLLPLLRFHSLKSPNDWISLTDYVQSMKDGQEKIYYVVGDDERSLINSPHLEMFRHQGYDVLLLADPIDPFMILRMSKFENHDLANVTKEKIEPSKTETDDNEKTEEQPQEDFAKLIVKFKNTLGDRVSDVKTTKNLVESPARLVDPENTLNPEMQRVYRLLKKEYQVPQKILELNPHHAIIRRLNEIDADDSRSELIIEQIFENALLIEGLHPDPANMITRIQKLMQTALNQ